MNRIVLLVALIISSYIHIEAKQWSLQDCINYAVENNISIKQKVLTKESAVEDLKGAKAAYFPSLTASTSQNLGWQPWKDEYQNTVQNGQAVTSASKTYYNGMYSVNASWTVWDGNQRRNTIKLDKLAAEAAELDSATTANSIQEQIVQYYVQILYTMEAVEVNKKALETAKLNEKRGKEMVEVGKMSKADLAQLTATTATDEYNVVLQEANLANYKRQLKQILQITNDEEFDVVMPSSTDQQALEQIPAMSTIYEAALVNRPEIESAKLNVEQQKLNVKIAQSGYMPTISLSGSLGTNTTSLTDTKWGTQMKTNFTGGAGVTVSIPIYDQRKTKTSVNKAKINELNSVLSLRNQEVTLYSNIEKYWLDATSNQSKYKAAKVSTESAQASYDLLSEQFRLGLKNIVELMTGKDKLLTAQQNELQSKYTTILNQQMLKFYKGEDMKL